MALTKLNYTARIIDVVLNREVVIYFKKKVVIRLKQFCVLLQ